MRAVVAAHNEEETVAKVVQTLLDSGSFDEVVVVDDGSTDRTSEIADEAGARVLTLPVNVGKGGAMRAAYETLTVDPDDDRVAFFDADLLTLGVDHVRAMAYCSSLGYDMVSLSQPRRVPIGYLTGIRIVRRPLLDALPATCWEGYCIETAMNAMIERTGGRSVRLELEPVQQRSRLTKLGVLGGIRGHVQTIMQIMSTCRALERSGGKSCR